VMPIFRGFLAVNARRGAFSSTVEGPQGRVADETCFVTAQVALILADPRAQAERQAVPGPHAEELERALSRALDFVETCAVPGMPGAFSFYPPDGTARLDIRLPPDADDTALAWMALMAGGRRDAAGGRNGASRAFCRDTGPSRRVAAIRPLRARRWSGHGLIRTRR
jgi:hypothetical protein